MTSLIRVRARLLFSSFFVTPGSGAAKHAHINLFVRVHACESLQEMKHGIFYG